MMPREPGGGGMFAGAMRSSAAPKSARRMAVMADAVGGESLADEDVMDGASVPVAAEPAEPATPAEPSSPGSKRLIIYPASYRVQVADTTNAIDTFVAEVEALGGFMSQRQNAQVTVRVPAASFDAMLARLPQMGTILSRQVQSLDVTADFLDVQLRLDTALKSRARLAALLERAEKMEDILRIEAEVRRLTEEIEVMKGRLRLLSDQIAFSTITVDFMKDAPEVTPLNQQRRSRFGWIRRVGLERILSDF